MRLFEDLPPAISHPAHTAHELELVKTGGAPFRCDGCMQPGDAGPRYSCEPCHFDLHTCCAVPTATLQHALFKKCTFTFHHEPTSGGQHCDACGDDVAGFVYHCRARGLDLHPTCAQLPERHVQDGQVFELRKEASRPCRFCGENGYRSKFWAYRSYCDGEVSYLHVACMKGAHRTRSIGGGGQIVLAEAPVIEGVLQSLPSSARRSRGFDRFRKIVGVVVSVIVAVIFGNPMALITAVAGPGGLLRG
jgi:hypothetical protein